MMKLQTLSSSWSTNWCPGETINANANTEQRGDCPQMPILFLPVALAMRVLIGSSWVFGVFFFFHYSFHKYWTLAVRWLNISDANKDFKVVCGLHEMVLTRLTYTITKAE